MTAYSRTNSKGVLFYLNWHLTLITLIILGDPGHAISKASAMRLGPDQLADLVVAEL